LSSANSPHRRNARSHAAGAQSCTNEESVDEVLRNDQLSTCWWFDLSRSLRNERQPRIVREGPANKHSFLSARRPDGSNSVVVLLCDCGQRSDVPRQ